MVYSTCSILWRENEGILEKILKEGTCELLPTALPFFVPHLSRMKNTMLILPDDLYEGFFCAVIRKN